MNTVQRLRDYLDWQCQVGRGDFKVKLSDDSITGVICDDVQIVPPQPEYMADDKNKIVFVKAIL